MEPQENEKLFPCPGGCGTTYIGPHSMEVYCHTCGAALDGSCQQGLTQRIASLERSLSEAQAENARLADERDDLKAKLEAAMADSARMRAFCEKVADPQCGCRPKCTCLEPSSLAIFREWAKGEAAQFVKPYDHADWLAADRERQRALGRAEALRAFANDTAGECDGCYQEAVGRARAAEERAKAEGR